MNYIDQIYKRTNLYQICSFLLFGTETTPTSDSSIQRLSSTEKAMAKRLKEKFPDPCDFNEITNLVYTYTAEIESVYTEIGLKTGVRLLMELLQNPLAE